MNELLLREVAGGVELQVRVAPRSSRNAVMGVHDGALKCSLTAPPVEGAANAALIELLAETLQVPKRSLRIERGEHGRLKTVRVDLDLPTLRLKLAPVLEAHIR